MVRRTIGRPRLDGGPTSRIEDAGGFARWDDARLAFAADVPIADVRSMRYRVNIPSPVLGASAAAAIRLLDLHVGPAKRIEMEDAAVMQGYRNVGEWLCAQVASASVETLGVSITGEARR